MARYAGITHSLLRFIAGLLLFSHGMQKLFGWFGGLPNGVFGMKLPHLLLTAAVIEVIGGALIMLGIATRPAAFITSGEMAVAYFIGHFPHGFWPAKNQGDPAVLFCFIFLFLAAAGAGPISLDHLIWTRRKRTAT